MSAVRMTPAAWLRQRRSPSRPACYQCGLSEHATIHGTDDWWQHPYDPGILTRIS